VILDGTLAVLNGTGGDVFFYDVSNPSAPARLGALTLDAAVTDLARHGDRLVAVHAEGSLTVADIRVPNQPAVLGRIAGSGSNGAGLLARSTAGRTRGRRDMATLPPHRAAKPLAARTPTYAPARGGVKRLTQRLAQLVGRPPVGLQAVFWAALPSAPVR
jgi:hypothetical protein